jgi:integrase
MFLQYQKERTDKGDITSATLINFVKALKLFCEMSDISIPWKKITRGLPRARETSNDGAPTTEEIRKLVKYPDRRIKAIIYTMVSSGIRLGAWDYLKWKHVAPLTNDTGDVVAAKITVYAGDIEEYYSFLTPEAYYSLKEWIDFRKSYGENIEDESWVMRDLWHCMFSHLNMMAQYYAEYHKQLVVPSGIDSGADNVHNSLCNNIMEIITGFPALFNLNTVGS